MENYYNINKYYILHTTYTHQSDSEALVSFELLLQLNSH